MKNPVATLTHTPGPWRLDWLDDDNAWVLDSNGNYLFEVVTSDGEGMCVSKEEQLANARLLAAAPELLEYCKMLLSDCTLMAEDHSVGADWDWSLTESNLEKIIAKAEGH